MDDDFENYIQRPGLCAGWEIANCLPVTVVDDCNIADVFSLLISVPSPRN